MALCASLKISPWSVPPMWMSTCEEYRRRCEPNGEEETRRAAAADAVTSLRSDMLVRPGSGCAPQEARVPDNASANARGRKIWPPQDNWISQ